MKLFDSNIVRLSLIVLFLGIVFKGSQTTLPTLQALPIHGINNAAQQNVADDQLKSLYPLVARHDKTVAALSSSSEIINVDNAFIPQTALPENTQSSAPDYFSLLKDNNFLTLQAITADGAIINGKFYTFGEFITDFSYPSGSGKNAFPIVLQATISSVLIKETPGKRRFMLALTK